MHAPVGECAVDSTSKQEVRTALNLVAADTTMTGLAIVFFRFGGALLVAGRPPSATRLRASRAFNSSFIVCATPTHDDDDKVSRIAGRSTAHRGTRTSGRFGSSFLDRTLRFFFCSKEHATAGITTS